MSYRWLIYTTAILLMLFFSITTTGVTYNDTGLMDILSMTLLLTAISLAGIMLHPLTGTGIVASAVMASASIQLGSILYLELYQSYVPASILKLYQEAFSLVAGYPLFYVVIAGIGFLATLAMLYYLASRLPRLPATATILSCALLLAAGLHLQLLHDKRGNKNFNYNNETPVGFFLRSAGLIPFIDGNPLLMRYKEIEGYALEAEHQQQLNRDLAEAVKAFYPQADDKSLYPLYRDHATSAPAFVKYKPRNVIVIVMESVRDSESEKHASLPSAMPFIDALKKESLSFSSNYATAALTAKSETAIHCGILDYLGGDSASLRKIQMRANCLPDILADEGYERYWFHGNDIEFYNRQYFLPEIGFNRIRSIEHYYGEEYTSYLPDSTDNPVDISKPMLGWGMPDPYLFELAFEELSRETKPFFAEILTVSNHLPFNWEWNIPFPEHLQERDGDTMYEAYRRGIYYTDKALEGFVGKFRNSPLYENTLLVITGDHGIWTFGKQQVSEINKFDQFFQVPLLFHGKMVEAGSVASPSSHLDIAPTILDVLGIDRPTAYLGKSLVSEEASSSPPIFMALEASYSIRHNNTMCIPQGRCFMNGLNECQDWRDKTMKHVNMACYDVSDNNPFAVTRPSVNPDPEELLKLDRLLDYALVGLEIGFVPEPGHQDRKVQPSDRMTSSDTGVRPLKTTQAAAASNQQRQL